MANPKILQFRRNSTTAGSYQEALDNIKAELVKRNYPGEPIVMFYEEGNTDNTKVLKAILGINYGGGKYQLIDVNGDVEAVNTAIAKLKGNVSTDNDSLEKIEKNLQTEVTRATAAESNNKIAINQEVSDRENAINALDLTDTAGALQFVTKVDQNDGKIAVSRKSLKSTDKTVKLTGTADSDVDLSVNVDGETIIRDEANGTLSVASKALTQYVGDGKTIEISDVDSDNNKTVKSLVTVKEVTTGLASTTARQWQLEDKNGTAIGDPIVVNKDNSFVDGYIGNDNDTVEKDETKPKGYKVVKNATPGPDSINLVYLNNEGNYVVVGINIAQYLKEAEFKDGFNVSEGGEVSVKLSNDTESKKYLTFDETGDRKAIKVSGVDAAIKTAVDALDVADTAEAGKYVSTVSETNGKISVNRANISDAVLNGYVKGTKPESTAIAATDDVKGAFAKVEHQIDDAKAAATTKVNTDTEGHVTVSSIANEDGSTTYTIGENDIASANDLTNEIVNRKAITGIDGDKYVAITDTESKINGATSLKDADDKLDTAIRTEVSARELAISTTNGNINKETTRAEEAEAAINSAVGLTETHAWTPTKNYGTDAKSVKGTVDAIDTQVKTNTDTIEKNKIVAADNSVVLDTTGVNTNIKVNIAPSVSEVRDGTTGDITTAGNANDMISVTDNGIVLSNVFDCGTY